MISETRSEPYYIDTAFGSAGHRNHVVRVDQLDIPIDTPDCFASMYRFGEEYRQLCDETRSVKGASKLSCDSDFLWFDIDSGDLTTALVRARSLVIRIELIDTTLSEQLAIYFSGSKGFHIGIPHGLFGWETSVDLPRIHRQLAADISGDVPIDTAIYEHNRLWRIPNTRHSKSGLYKVPLTCDQLATWEIDRIRQFAQKPTGKPALAVPSPNSGGPHATLQSLYQQAVEKVRRSRETKALPQSLRVAAQVLDRPCLQTLLRGVEAGQRNETAIRLSAAFKQAGYSPEGILAELQTWNHKNRPPMPENELESACRSAFDGPYDYGCNDPVLSRLCDPSCHLKQKKPSRKSKKPKYDSFVTLCDGSLAEMVIGLSGSQFATYNPFSDSCDSSDGYLEVLPGNILPYPAETMQRLKAVHFPSAAEAFGTEAALIDEIDRFIRKYLAVSDFFHQIVPYYVLFTWVYDRFSELPYLRVIGDLGTGKSRFLKVVGSICYKPIFCMGAASVSSIFRLLDMFKGTLVLDESDFNNSDEAHLTIKMLNTGYQKGFPLWRSETAKKGYFEPTSFDVYSPKIIATRKEFQDKALESRCLTEHMDGKVRSGIPVSLNDGFWDEAREIRNKLLTWRFRNYYQVKPPTEVLDLKIHPRLAQILYPLSSVIKDEAVLRGLKTFMLEQDARLKEARLDSPEGRIVRAMLELRDNAEAGRLTIKQIADKVNESITNDRFKMSGERVGRIISKTLGLPRERTGHRRNVLIDSKEAKQKLKYWCNQFGLEEE